MTQRQRNASGELEPLTEDQIWPGTEDRECSDHRPLGIGYSWCYTCAEKCSASAPCARCELPGLTVERDQLRACVEVIREWRLNTLQWATRQAKSPELNKSSYARAQLAIMEDIQGMLVLAPPERS